MKVPYRSVENGSVIDAKGFRSMSPEELKKRGLKLVLCGHIANQEGVCACIGGGKKLFVVFQHDEGTLFGKNAPTTFVRAIRFDVKTEDRQTVWVPKSIAYSLKPHQEKIQLVIALYAKLRAGEIPDFNDFRNLPELLTAH
jgi:hypothetical protein